MAGQFRSWVEKIRCHACGTDQDAVVSSHKRYHHCVKCRAVNNNSSWTYSSIADWHNAEKQRKQGIRK